MSEVNGELLDVTTVDPSMAGAAGGNALVTSAHDLVRFLDGLLAGRLFRRPETLQAMLDFQPAIRRTGAGRLRPRPPAARPPGRHRDDRPSRRRGRLHGLRRAAHAEEMTMALAFNAMVGDPSPVLLPVLEALATPSG